MHLLKTRTAKFSKSIQLDTIGRHLTSHLAVFIITMLIVLVSQSAYTFAATPLPPNTGPDAGSNIYYTVVSGSPSASNNQLYAPGLYLKIYINENAPHSTPGAALRVVIKDGYMCQRTNPIWDDLNGNKSQKTYYQFFRADQNENQDLGVGGLIIKRDSGTRCGDGDVVQDISLGNFTSSNLDGHRGLKVIILKVFLSNDGGFNQAEPSDNGPLNAFRIELQDAGLGNSGNTKRVNWAGIGLAASKDNSYPVNLIGRPNGCSSGYGVTGHAEGGCRDSYSFKFMPPCNYFSGNPNPVPLQWYDDDMGAGNQPYQLTMYVNRGTAGGAPSDVMQVPFVGQYNWSGNGNWSSASLMLHAGKRYTWEWGSVTRANGVSFKLPFDSANYYIGCNQEGGYKPSECTVKVPDIVVTGQKFQAEFTLTNKSRKSWYITPNASTPSTPYYVMMRKDVSSYGGKGIIAIPSNRYYPEESSSYFYSGDGEWAERTPHWWKTENDANHLFTAPSTAGTYQFDWHVGIQQTSNDAGTASIVTSPAEGQATCSTQIRVVANRPYVRTWQNDTWVGALFAQKTLSGAYSCDVYSRAVKNSANNASAKTYTASFIGPADGKQTKTVFGGSGSDYGLFATGQIHSNTYDDVGFAGSNGLTDLDAQRDSTQFNLKGYDLLFANKVDGKDAYSQYGEFSNYLCLDNYFDKFYSDDLPEPHQVFGTIFNFNDIGFGETKIYKTSQNYLSLSAIPEGANVILVVDASTMSNKTFKLNGFAGYSKPGTLEHPTKFTLIVKGNLEVDSTVTTLRGDYIVQPLTQKQSDGSYKLDGNTGVFNSCGSTPTTVTGACNKQLDLRGRLLAQKLNLNRVHGTIGYTDGNTVSYTGLINNTNFDYCTTTTTWSIVALNACTAEIVAFNPALYLPALNSNSKIDTVQSIKELPPIY